MGLILCTTWKNDLLGRLLTGRIRYLLYGTRYQLLFFVSHTHTRSSWIPAAIPPNHPTSRPWSLQGSCLVVVDSVCNTSWRGFLRPSLELHVRLNNEKSIGCLCRHHWIHQLKQRQLCFTKYGLEGRLWHQSGGQTASSHKTSHWSGGAPPIWCQDVVGEYTLTCHVGSTPLGTSPSLLLFWWGVASRRIWSYSGWTGSTVFLQFQRFSI